jgi:hypothetical protein
MAQSISPGQVQEPHGQLVVRPGGDLGGGSHFLILVLQLVKFVVDAVLGEQLLVRAHLADLSFVHDDNFVGALDGRKAVRDDH